MIEKRVDGKMGFDSFLARYGPLFEYINADLAIPLLAHLSKETHQPLYSNRITHMIPGETKASDFYRIFTELSDFLEGDMFLFHESDEEEIKAAIRIPRNNVVLFFEVYDEFERHTDDVNEEEAKDCLIHTGIFAGSMGDIKSTRGKLLDRWEIFDRAGMKKRGDQVAFCSISNGNIVPIYRNIQKLPFESIKENYSTETVGQVRYMLDRVNPDESGIVTLHGPPGTGKTYLIRSILHELRERHGAIICSPAVQFLGDSSLLGKALSEKENPIVILEDLGDLVSREYAKDHINIFTTLLNFTDGLYSMVRNVIFVLSFNLPETKIDPAFLRPGRCIANINVEHLTRKHATELLSKWGGNAGAMDPNQDKFTLADMYAILHNQKVSHVLPEKSSSFNDRRAGF